MHKAKLAFYMPIAFSSLRTTLYPHHFIFILVLLLIPFSLIEHDASSPSLEPLLLYHLNNVV